MASYSRIRKTANIAFLLGQELLLNKQELTEEEKEEKALCEKSLYEFSKAAWHVINPGFLYIDNWHIKAICDHLEAAYKGQIHRLLINIPSRCMKSTLCNIFFPAWVWAQEPHLKFLSLTGDYDLALRDNVACRVLLTSAWYQKYWGRTVQISKDVNTKERYTNTAGGAKIIKTIKGSAMGEGGNFIIADDVNNTKEIYSNVLREYTNAVIDSTIAVRVDMISQSREGCFIGIQQRLHEFDNTGHWLAKCDPDLVHLMIPMKFEGNRKCKTISFGNSKIVWEDPRTEEGELLWPQRWNVAKVKRIEVGYGSQANIQSQLQQNPTPAQGSIIQKHWFREWKQENPPACHLIVQSWDTALSTSETACDSAMVTIGVFKNEYDVNHIILLNCWSGKLANHDLRKMMIKCAENYRTSSFAAPHQEGPRPHMILIEEAMNGIPLIHDLKMGGISNVVGFNPRTHGFKTYNNRDVVSKIERTNFASMLIETGVFWLPSLPQSQYTRLYDFAEKFREACLRYPRGNSKDILDATAQTIIWMAHRGVIHHRGEDPAPASIDLSAHETVYANDEWVPGTMRM